jgi:hypothetical protein
VALYGMFEADGEISEVASSRNPIVLEDGATLGDVNFDLTGGGTEPGTGEGGTLYIRHSDMGTYLGVVVTRAIPTAESSGGIAEAIHCGVSDGSGETIEGFLVPWDGSFDIDCPTSPSDPAAVLEPDLYVIETMVFEDMSPESDAIACLEEEVLIAGDTVAELPELGECEV